MTDLVENLIPSRTVIVGFASMGEDCGGGIPPFEWARTFSDLGVATVLMRDRHLCWYQKGVEGVGGVLDVAAYVRNLRETYPRVITVGISMGGYAAILFGCLGGATDIVAMSPQTRLADDDRWDKHWATYVHPICYYPDLRPVVEKWNGNLRVFVGGGDKHVGRDCAHARHVANGNYTIIEDVDHSTVGRHLRDTGYFERIALS